MTGLWLMPIAEAASYHGYDATDLTAVERDYGAADDLRALVAAAHERGIGVILDLVLNHTSDDHPWFVDARTPGSTHDDWYLWSETDPGYPGPDGQDVWHEADGRYYYGLFGPDLPDLNLANPDVTDALGDAAHYWLTDLDVDGFRLDAIRHMVETGEQQVHTVATHAWLQDFRATVRTINPGALLVGEVYDLTSASATYVPDDVDMVFDFDLADATLDAIDRGSVSRLTTAVADGIREFGPGERASFLTNHDQERVASVLEEDPTRLALAARVLLADPGVPFLYYGEEIGLTGEKPDERIRTPLPWTGEPPAAGFSTSDPWEALEPGWETRNVAAQQPDPGSLLATYRDAIALRNQHPALRRGSLELLETDHDGVFARLQQVPGEDLLVLVNVSGEPVADYRLAVESSDLCGRIRATVIVSADGVLPSAGDAEATGPVLDESGGFADYRPVAELAPLSLTIVGLVGE